MPAAVQDLGFGYTRFGVPFCGDMEALVALYEAAGGANWTNNTNWLSDEPIGTWHGVTTNTNGRVTDLLLHNNGLSGTMPAELSSLINLTQLGLAGNGLSGSIPAELGNLNRLESLSLNNNQLSGTIPAELGNLENLTTLHLSSNQLSGCVPASLSDVSNNDLDGLGLPFCE